MQLPMLHANGSSQAQLVEDLGVASQALRAAIAALKITAPNGRDYYLLPRGAMEQAVLEHNCRVQMIEAVETEVRALMVAIAKIVT